VNSLRARLFVALSLALLVALGAGGVLIYELAGSALHAELDARLDASLLSAIESANEAAARAAPAAAPGSDRELEGKDETPGSIADDPADSFVPGGPGTVAIPVTIPAGTSYARFSLFDANVSPASDIDLYVVNSANVIVAASGGATSNEEANLLNPAAGNYTVWVHGFNVPGTANFTLFRWTLGTLPAGNMTVNAPAAAVQGTTGVIGLTFNGLTPGIKYLGSVAYGGSAGLPSPTIVRVDP